MSGSQWEAPGSGDCRSRRTTHAGSAPEHAPAACCGVRCASLFKPAVVCCGERVPRSQRLTGAGRLLTAQVTGPAAGSTGAGVDDPGSRHQCKGPVNPVRPAVRSSCVPRRVPRSTATFCRRRCRCPMCHRAAGDSGCRDVAQWRISRDVGQRRRGGARTVDGVTRCPWSELAQLSRRAGVSPLLVVHEVRLGQRHNVCAVAAMTLAADDTPCRT